MYPGSVSLLDYLVPPAFSLEFCQLCQVFTLKLDFHRVEASVVGRNQGQPLIESLNPLESVVEVPCRLPSDAASVHFAAVWAQTMVQSSSCSVPLTKFVGMYHNLVPRCYRGLGWSDYDLAESDPYYCDNFWRDAS
jgi:hypothetical protein